MLWIILTILITIVVIRLGRRFSWSPAHILNLEGYEWLDDFLNWILIQYDCSQLCILVSESVQEQFKRRAPPGWTLKLEGPPLFLSSAENSLTFSKSSSLPSHYGQESPHLHKQTGEVIPKSMKVPKVTTHNLLSNLSSSSAAYPISVKRIQTLHKNSREVVLALDVKVVNLSQEVFITSRHANQLESSRCKVDLVKLTGQLKLRLASSPSENIIDASICFAGPPKVNIHIPRHSFQKEETILALDVLLRESVSAFGVKLPLLGTTNRGINAHNSDGKASPYSNNLQEVLRNESPHADVLRNRLNVKVLKANSLYESGNHEVYCVVTVDSPPQTQRTSSVADSPNPFFDELLTFQLDGTTKRISFEIHEKNNLEAFLGRADFLLKDASEEVTEKDMRVVLPLMSQHPTSHMSLTVEISSANWNVSSGQFPKKETDKKKDTLDVNYVQPPNSVVNPSINIERFLQKPKQDSDRALYPSQWKNNNSQTDSNLSLVSQASLMVRNNSHESASSKVQGRSKQRSLIDAMKKKFHGKRSRSAEPSSKETAHTSREVKIFSDGIYLTPPPKRILTPGHLEHWSLSSSTSSPQGFSPGKKRSKMSSFKNLFRRKNQGSSPHQMPEQQI